MHMPWGKYGPEKFPPRGADICFINSGYLRWLSGQEWFFMKKGNEELVVAIEKELEMRENSGGHFYEDKVRSER